MKSSVVAFLASLLLLFGCSCSHQKLVKPAGEVPVLELVQRTVKVEVNCDDKEGTGSGVILRGRDYGLTIATAEHVVAGENCKMIVQEWNGERHRVWRHRVDVKHDVAVMYTLSGRLYKELPTRRAQLGEQVIAVGYPWDPRVVEPTQTVTRGVIAAFYTREDLQHSAVRITAEIGPGSSGGPTFGLDGALLGLNVRKRVVYPWHDYMTHVKHVEDLL